MELYPAIDVRGGRCVRLRQGDYAAETTYDDDPVAVARRFASAGARWIHVVDLDAARSGEAVNRTVVAAVCTAAVEGGAQVEVGGGVRTEEAAHALWDAGARRVVVGTAAVEDPDLVRRLAGAGRGEVAVGIDSRAGEVAVRGWLAGGGLRAADLLGRYAGAGVAAVIVTDIGRDGMLAGPDLSGLAAILDTISLDTTGLDVGTLEVIASGGVSSVEDLRALAALRGPRSGRRLQGAIVGKALYEGRFTAEEGIMACAASG